MKTHPSPAADAPHSIVTSHIVLMVGISIRYFVVNSLRLDHYFTSTILRLPLSSKSAIECSKISRRMS